MSDTTTGQVLGATTTAGGIALLPSTGSESLFRFLLVAVIAMGGIMLLSFTLSRIYRSSKR